MNLKETWETSRKFITEYTGKEPGTNGDRNTTQYDVDKGSTHTYLEAYENCLNKYKGRPINILEIGISGGWSLYMWKQYFDEGSNIVGIDIDPLNLIWKDENKETKMIFSDINDYDKVVSELGDMEFDIIIDDGSHTIEDQYNTYNFLFSTRLKSGGTYIIEDFANLETHITHFLQFSPKIVDMRESKGRYDDVLVIFEK